MKKSITDSVLGKSKTARQDRMVETASIKATAMVDGGQYTAVDPVAGKISAQTPMMSSSVDSMALAALNNIAKTVGGTVKNNCMIKDYNGYKFCIKYEFASGSNASFEFSLTKGSATQLKFSQESYCSQNDNTCRIDTYQMDSVQRCGEQAYAFGFPIEQDLLLVLNMIKLDLSKTNSKKYYG